MSKFIRESGKYKPYELQHRFRKRIFLLIKIIFLIFLLHLLISNLFIFTFRTESDSMVPGISRGESFLVSPFAYGPRIPFTYSRLFTVKKPARGDLILYLPDHARPGGILLQIADPFVRFFTLNKVSTISSSAREQIPQYMIRRIIGIPGDTIRIEGKNVSIKVKDNEYFFSEHEQILIEYDLEQYQESIFDDNYLELHEDQYYILGDNRNSSLDSRHFGPIQEGSIMGKVILRYFPLNKFGTI